MADDNRARLVDAVRDRINRDEALAPEVAELISEAFDAAPPLVGPATTTADSMYLREITVQGFRGVGPETTLPLRPGPGLTLVVGRNGVGKSSFAEAAELAMTGTSKRWDGRATRTWREGWRNVHSTDASRIRLELSCDGGEDGLTIVRDWSRADALEQGTWTQCRSGEQPAEFDAAYWTPRMQLFRPFLSYSELGSLIDGRPSELYDAMHKVLGLDELADARKAISERRLTLEKAAKSVESERKDLLTRLAEVDDDRARITMGILDSRHPDLTRLADVTVGGQGDVAGLADLRAIEAIRLPERVDVENIAMRIRTAADAVVRASTDEADASSRAIGLWKAAVEHHRTGGDCPCPVCGVGQLDEQWATTAAARIAAFDEQSALLRQANTRLAAAMKAARDVVEGPPGALRVSMTGIDSSDALSCWTNWAAVSEIEGHVELADRLMTTYQLLSAAIGALRASAAAALARLDEQWAPLARQLAAWHGRAAAARARKQELAILKKAESWLKDAQSDLQNDRVKPFAAQSQEVWRALGHQSSVQLGQLTLSGTTTNRHVALRVTVDGTETSALAVMSQGELHALALSLFLPRATADDSPLRFIVIDDPVQAMDAVRVDGLAQVLANAAESRQVVVFSHDERLPDAVCRLGIEATVREVTRARRSVVGVR